MPKYFYLLNYLPKRLKLQISDYYDKLLENK